MASILAGVAVSVKRSPRFGVAPDAIRNVAMIIIIASLIGSHIWYVLYHLDRYRGHWIDLILIGRGGRIGCSGLSMMGGVVLAILGVLVYARMQRLSFLALADVIAPAFLLGSGIQRLGGCFLSGCCYGMPTQSILGIVFPETGDAGRHFPGTPLWPTQLMASALGFAGFVLALWRERRHCFPGYTFCLVFAYYPLERFLVDQFRYYDPAQVLGTLGPLTINVNHPILLGLFVGSITSWAISQSRNKGPHKAG